MSIFLHGAKPASQILPEGQRLNCNHFGTKIEKTCNRDTFGEHTLLILSMWGNLDREIPLGLCKYPPKKASFCKIVCPPKLLPQLANIFTRIYPSYPWHFATLTRTQPNTVLYFPSQLHRNMILCYARRDLKWQHRDLKWRSTLSKYLSRKGFLLNAYKKRTTF